MSFWDIVWFIIITYAFVAYLVILFHIIGDIFRDPDLSGVLKALVGGRCCASSPCSARSST